MLVGDGGEDGLQLAPAALRLWEQVAHKAASMTSTWWSLMRKLCLACAWTSLAQDLALDNQTILKSHPRARLRKSTHWRGRLDRYVELPARIESPSALQRWLPQASWLMVSCCAPNLPSLTLNVCPRQARLTPYAAAKDVVAFLLCPADLVAAGTQLLRTLAAVYAGCRLGSHVVAADGVIAYSHGGGTDAAGGSRMREAAERLQKRLLLHPPPLGCAVRHPPLDTPAAAWWAVVSHERGHTAQVIRSCACVVLSLQVHRCPGI